MSRQVSCLLASGVQDRSKETGWRLMMPARAWLLSGLQRLTSMWLHRRLSQLLQGGVEFKSNQVLKRPTQKDKARARTHTQQGRDAPLVPGLADAHAGEQLGSSQVPEDRHPHLLLTPLLVAHVLEGGQRQQGGRRQGEGGTSSHRLVLRGGAGGGKATFDPTEPRPRRVATCGKQ